MACADRRPWRAAIATLTLAAGAQAFVGPSSARLFARSPAVSRSAVSQSNIFEKAAQNAAKAVGSGINKVAGLPELSEEEQKEMEQAMLAGTMNFDQFLIQMQVMAKAGSISKTLANIPGASGQIDPNAAAMAEKKLKRYEEYCNAMQPEERTDPSLLLPGSSTAAMRLEKLSAATGASDEDLFQFLGEFQVMRKTSQAFAQGKKPDEVQAIMTEAQQDVGMAVNRRERRLAAKEAKKAKKGNKSAGFG
mmetsp:Transcript_5826/g.15884  ORF Transcript_5826/g.15884 Transcript_5826/m.15884 type:complete len:249 (-) Transcript_5826:659-1405(-)